MDESVVHEEVATENGDGERQETKRRRVAGNGDEGKEGNDAASHSDDHADENDFDALLKEYATTISNASSCTLASPVPEITKRKKCWMGIDEAGRGPVLGPMVYGISYGPIEGEDRLKGFGFKDSKQLTEVERERLFKAIKGSEDFLGWIVAVLTPQDISGHMLGRKNYNLNAMSHDCAIDLVKQVIASGVNLTELYVDTVGKEEHYQRKLEYLFPDLEKIVVTSKADDKFPIVSAASICAKVTRDHMLQAWQLRERVKSSKEFGSGYPGDPVTVEWLQKHGDNVFGFPGCVRFSWSTARKLMEEKCAHVTWESDEEEDTPSVMSFFSAKAKKSKARHRLFQSARLSVVNDF
eukprot:m.540244 g.540244  ORF g.540244 m.540244 type:complete len:352 (-) comp22096_c0_seq3:1371-2426(-)